MAHRIEVRSQAHNPVLEVKPQAEDPIAKAIATAQAANPAAQVIALPDGRLIELSLPQRSIAATVTMIAAELTEQMQDASMTARSMALIALQPQIEALLYVRSVDGERVMVSTASHYKGVADRLTDRGIHAILQAIQEFWPQPSAKNLPEVKKNH